MSAESRSESVHEGGLGACDLVDEDYPDRDRIVLVMDNLNTHGCPRYTRHSG